MCTGIEIALITTAAAAASTSGYQASESVQAGRRAANKAEDLEDQRRKQLAGESAVREAAKKKAETAGQRVGLTGRNALFGNPTAFGAGSGDTPTGGRGALFGN